MNKKILVVDDTRVSAELVCAMLQHVGLRAEFVESGEQALAWLDQNEADLVLSDWRMPGMNGQELAQAIRKRNEKAARPWLIAYTAYAEEAERATILTGGFDEVLRKPARPDVLARTVKSWLGRPATI